MQALQAAPKVLPTQCSGHSHMVQTPAPHTKVATGKTASTSCLHILSSSSPCGLQLGPRKGQRSALVQLAISGIHDSLQSGASGEWEGVTATFTKDGSPQELPYHQVPQAFR